MKIDIIKKKIKSFTKIETIDINEYYYLQFKIVLLLFYLVIPLANISSLLLNLLLSSFSVKDRFSEFYEDHPEIKNDSNFFVKFYLFIVQISYFLFRYILNVTTKLFIFQNSNDFDQEYFIYYYRALIYKLKSDVTNMDLFLTFEIRLYLSLVLIRYFALPLFVIVYNFLKKPQKQKKKPSAKPKASPIIPLEENASDAIVIPTTNNSGIFSQFLSEHPIIFSVLILGTAIIVGGTAVGIYIYSNNINAPCDNKYNRRNNDK